MLRGQINGLYDVSYFDAENNQYENKKAQLWWSSSNRYAVELGSQTSEYIEIDLTKRRLVNYISFDIVQKPIDIQIEYDSVDLANVDDYSDVPRWKKVTRNGGEPFDSSASYQSDHINPWKHCEFYFLDENGNLLITRRLRIKFTRRTDSWPTQNMTSFVWTVDVKNLRAARYISNKKHLAGELIDISSYSGSRNFPYELRQRFSILDSFVIPSNQTADLTNIDGFVPSDIAPKLMGFDVLVNPTAEGKAVLNWSLYNVSSVPRLITSGTCTKTIKRELPVESDNPAGEVEEVIPSMKWLNVSFDKPVQTSAGQKYEIRIKNGSPGVLRKYYYLSANPNKQGGVSEDFDVYVVNAAGTVSQSKDTTMVYRLIADTGHEGKDLLGNGYREGVRYNSASGAIDGKSYTNWTSFPNPSQDGVEALYFDVRKLTAGVYSPSVVDAIEVNTLTPGVKMNIYYSKQKMANNAAPRNIKDWENMMWTPVRDSFRLNQKQTIDLPYPISANWICLEFYNLQAVPLGLSNYPMLPEVEFKEFPEWVYTNNPTPLPTNDEPYLEQEKFVGFKITDVVSPSLESIGGLRTYFDGPQTLDNNIALNGSGTADPKLLGKISFSKNPYAQPSINYVDTTSLLGDFVYQDYTNDQSKTYISEAPQYPRVVTSRNVSNANDRRVASRYDETHALFNRVCAHQYAVKKARYNKKAFLVSVSEVGFLRKDYSVEGDDPVIHDVLVFENADESMLIESSSWEPEQRISMPLGAPIYVTYTAGGSTYVDELVYFEPANSTEPSFGPVTLAGSGSIATSVIGRSGAFKQGNTYYRDQDFIIVYDPDSKQNSIQRNDIPARLVTPEITNSVDKYTVMGAAIIIVETGVEGEDQVELGAKDGSPLITGSSSSGVTTLTPPVTGGSASRSTVYGTITDPTD